MTPGTLSKSDSTHQKQPPAKVATAVLADDGAAPVDCAKAAVPAATSEKATTRKRVMRCIPIAGGLIPTFGCQMLGSVSPLAYCSGATYPNRWQPSVWV